MAAKPKTPEYPEVFNPAEFEDPELHRSKLLKKAKEEPFVPIGKKHPRVFQSFSASIVYIFVQNHFPGIALGLGVLAYQAYRFKNRGNLPVSVYLIHTRVFAQVNKFSHPCYGLRSKFA
jgi:hypothetical protein